ncbi:hypothetical protein [Cryptosporangium aurantiacum]|uniref:Uncharacterized protein n=1 Tax=Cryptosporangium aurantiacum TaxID=134849 RepID=A0A1M7QXN3_9ACTN|nr:hypothetical protein [Cryptosporangium aurantiacum]SHN36776.1 hypothetical protein SAMN05443668_105574 [Cryptosporangium aurantiacum]
MLNAPECALDDLLRVHESRQALAARAAYSLLRISAAVPPDHRTVVGAADAGQRAGAWLAAASTNPGRWTNRAVLTAELAELDVLLVDLRTHLVVVLDWLNVHLGTQVARAGRPETIRVPRTLFAECKALVEDLTDLAPAAAA